MLRLLGSKLKQRPLLFRHAYLFSTSPPKHSISSDPQSFTVSYLRNSCGLSLESAISAARKLQIEPQHNPDSILSLFRTHGLNQTHIRNIISKRPSLLLADLNSRVRPNLEVLHSLGFKSSSLAQVVLKDPIVLESDAKAMLEFFRSHGFSEENIVSLTMKRPGLYATDAHKYFKPKMEFFKSIGFSELKIARVLSNEPYILTRSLGNCIVPSVERLRRLLGNDEDVVKAVMKCYRILEIPLEKVLVPNIDILKSHGVPESLIVKALVIQPATLLLGADKFCEGIGFIEGLGISPNSMKFLRALSAVAAVSKARWEQKLETYRSCGMSKDDIYSAFILQPYFMMVSVEKIQKMMNFFLSKANLNPLTISKNPNIVLLSLEKRIIPRCSVLQLLSSHDLIKIDSKYIVRVLKMTEETFNEKIMKKYKEVVPDVIKAQKGEIEFEGFSFSLSL